MLFWIINSALNFVNFYRTLLSGEVSISLSSCSVILILDIKLSRFSGISCSWIVGKRTNHIFSTSCYVFDLLNIFNSYLFKGFCLLRSFEQLSLYACFGKMSIVFLKKFFPAKIWWIFLKRIYRRNFFDFWCQKRSKPLILLAFECVWSVGKNKC